MILRDIAFARPVGSASPRNCDTAYYVPFNRATASIADLVLQHLVGYRTPSTAKIFVAQYNPGEVPRRQAPMQLINVLDLSWEFDVDLFYRLDDDAKRTMIGHSLQDAIVWAARAEGWHLPPIIEAFRACEARQFRNSGYWKQGVKKWNPSRARYVKTCYEFGLEFIRIEFEFGRKRSTAVVKKEVITVAAFDDARRELIADVRWVSEEEVELVGKGKREWVVTAP